MTSFSKRGNPSVEFLEWSGSWLSSLLPLFLAPGYQKKTFFLEPVLMMGSLLE